MRIGVWLLAATLVLVAVGCAMYVKGSVGWAQCVWVIASGTAGGAVAVLIDQRVNR